jgi:hypothetical protein
MSMARYGDDSLPTGMTRIKQSVCLPILPIFPFLRIVFYSYNIVNPFNFTFSHVFDEAGVTEKKPTTGTSALAP